MNTLYTLALVLSGLAGLAIACAIVGMASLAVLAKGK